MNLNFKKKVLYFGAIIFIAGMSVVISSCSSDEDGSDNRMHYMDTVAESDEFIDFVDMSEVLSKKTYLIPLLYLKKSLTSLCII